MAEQSVGNTALGSAVCRLIEQYKPRDTRLLDDPIVQYLVGGPIRLLMKIRAMRNFTLRQTDSRMKGIRHPGLPGQVQR
jgi:O-methyltransferase involved in polyketide biosynthesis